jgi:cytochrome c oxidase subunit 4
MTRVTTRATTVTALSLFGLWAASWALSYVDLGPWSLVVALAIAAVKAALVALFFMEMLQEGTTIHATLVAGLAMVAVLVFFMVADVRTRAAPPLLPPVSRAAAR